LADQPWKTTFAEAEERLFGPYMLPLFDCALLFTHGLATPQTSSK
jgi:hypothetical protein